MKILIYHILHVVSMVLLTAYTFQAFANPDRTRRKRIMMITGILALIMLITGFGMVAVMKIGFPLWIIIKIICWFGLASIAGQAYRFPKQIPLLTGITVALILLAVSAVYLRFGEGVFE